MSQKMIRKQLTFMAPKVGQTVVFYLLGTDDGVPAYDGTTAQVIEVVDDETVKLEVLSRTSQQLTVVVAKRARHPRPPGTWDFLA